MLLHLAEDGVDRRQRAFREDLRRVWVRGAGLEWNLVEAIHVCLVDEPELGQVVDIGCDGVLRQLLHIRTNISQFVVKRNRYRQILIIV